MGASPKAWARIDKHLRRTVMARRSIAPDTHPVQYAHMTRFINDLLDEWYDYQHRATEWDADHWGLSGEWTQLLNLIKAKSMVKGMDGRWYPTTHSTKTSVILKSTTSQ